MIEALEAVQTETPEHQALIEETYLRELRVRRSSNLTSLTNNFANPLLRLTSSLTGQRSQPVQILSDGGADTRFGPARQPQLRCEAGLRRATAGVA